MKILFLCRLYWPHVGGVEKHVRELSKRLEKREYKVTIVCEKHDLNLPDQYGRIYRMPVGNKLTVWRWWLAHLYLIKQADIVHIHDVFWWYLPFRLLFPLKKVFMTFHGFEGTRPNFKQIFWHRLASWLTLGNICVGGYHTKWYGVKPTFVTYGAVS